MSCVPVDELDYGPFFSPFDPEIARVRGNDYVGKRRAALLNQAGAFVMETAINVPGPCLGLEALLEVIGPIRGFPVVTSKLVSEADIFVSTPNKDIIMVDHIKKMKNNPIVCNIGHFDNEIDMDGLETFPGVKRITIKPQTDRWVYISVPLEGPYKPRKKL